MHRVRNMFEPTRRRCVAALLAATVTPLALARAQSSSWTIVELGVGVEGAVPTGALAINDAGLAAGWVGDAPALFTPDGRARRLGERAGRALGFDRQGRVVGRFFGSDDGPPVPFVGVGDVLVEVASIAHTAVESAPGAAPPGASFAQAYGRNRAGDAVGASDTGAGTMQRAMLWRTQGRVVDLGALAEVRIVGWRHLLVAYAINDRGTIVGVGTRHDGAMRGFMLAQGSR